MKSLPPEGGAGTGARAAGSTIHFSLTSLAVWSLSIIAGTALITHHFGYRVLPDSLRGVHGAPGDVPAPGPAARPPAPCPPWGELDTQDIELEQPEEYVSFEATTNRVVSWTFPGSDPAQVRLLLQECGLDVGDIDATLAHARETPLATVLNPDDQVVMSLSPPVRTRLYTRLAQWPENKLMRQPYHLQEGVFEGLFARSGVDPATVDLVRRLMYRRGGNCYFSDPEVLLHRLPSAEDRLHLLKALTYQTAVLVRMRLRPESDIDKILGYWCTAPGVRSKDLRPLLESLQKVPGGGTISLLYLLPPFARERLYTFPLPGGPTDAREDCHWSALNFFSDVPDDRLKDLAYASNFIQENFYCIGKPSMPGDLVFLQDAEGGVIHSAVFLADDLVFTKNGINIGQPWIIMRLSKLLMVYTFTTEPTVVYYRRRAI